MPVLSFSAKNLKTLACPPNRQKIDFNDARCKGLMLEIRESGGQTWYLRYRDHRGSQRQFRIGDVRDLGLSQARRRADELRTKIAMGKDPSEEKTLLRQIPTLEAFVAERYLPFIKGYKRSWQADDSYLRNHLLPAFGKRHMDQIAKQGVIEFFHAMPEKGYARGTANRCLILLRYIFNLAIKWEIVGANVNPTRGVALLQENNKRERYLSSEEAQRLYAAILESDNSQLRYIIPLLILTGARKREVLDAKWDDFDMARRLWRIPMSKLGHARHVPLSNGVIQLLDTIPHFKDCPFLVPNPTTLNPYVSVFNSWNSARKQANLLDLRIHDLRHSFASFLVNAGRSLYEVQKILGHTQIRTTQRYAHLAQETLVDAADAAVNALGLTFGPKGEPGFSDSRRIETKTT